MNKVEMLGRLTRDPDIRTSQRDGNTIMIARYTLAVNRKFNKNSNQQSADFVPCIAFGSHAEFAEKYLKKGTRITVIGRIQTGSYVNNEGQTIYTVEVVVEENEFVDKKQSSDGPDKGAEISTEAEKAGFMDIPTEFEEELPY